jgi:hypothetical protein
MEKQTYGVTDNETCPFIALKPNMFFLDKGTKFQPLLF